MFKFIKHYLNNALGVFREFVQHYVASVLLSK